MQAGEPQQHTRVVQEPLAETLSWGQVLVSVRAAPINPADIHAMQSGGLYGDAAVAAPFIAGMDGVGIVMRVSARLVDPNDMSITCHHMYVQGAAAALIDHWVLKTCCISMVAWNGWRPECSPPLG